MIDEHAAWYLSRASGIVAWLLAAVSILLGMAFSARARRPTPAWTLVIHRHSSALACAFTLVHVSVLMLDPWLAPTFTELVVPFASDYRPTAVAFGQFALYLLVVAQVSGLLRARLSRKAFHLVHLSAFPVFVLSTIHFLTAGSDVKSIWAQTAVLAFAGAVLIAVLFRVRATTAPRHTHREPWPRSTAPLDPPVELQTGTLSDTNAAAGATVSGSFPPPPWPPPSVAVDCDDQAPPGR